MTEWSKLSDKRPKSDSLIRVWWPACGGAPLPAFYSSHDTIDLDRRCTGIMILPLLHLSDIYWCPEEYPPGV